MQAFGKLDIRDIPHFFTQKSFSTRTTGKDFIFFVILITGADQLVGGCFAGCHIFDLHLTSENNGSMRKCADINDGGTGQFILEKVNFGLKKPLVLTGGVVLRIFA